MRIHIGKISPSLAAEVEVLEKRLEKYGTLESQIELGRKPLGDTFYAFVDMDVDEAKFKELRTALHGTTFRQSKLSIEEAKPKFEIVAEPERQKPVNPEVYLNDEQRKRLKKAPYEIDVYAGRHRQAERKDLKNATVRILKPATETHPERTIKLKSPKIKLWGYEKRKPEQLVYEFVDGKWKNSLGETVEVKGADEQTRNQITAEQVTNDMYLSDSDFEDFRSTAAKLQDADYDDDEIEIVSKDIAPRSNNYDSESDEDLYYQTEPQQVDVEAEMEDAEPVEEPIQELEVEPNTTEALRSVLSVAAPFTLFGGDADEEPETATAVVAAAPVEAVPRRRLGLFFAHTRSPFLRSQTQASKLFGASFDNEVWEKLFFENRGDWNRQLRHRRKEVQKQQRRRK